MSRCRLWRERGGGDHLVVAINVSPIQFRPGDIEHEVADAQHVSDVLPRLSAQGIQFAIDDFGTGYSNLGDLQRCSVHRRKIDQSFARKLADSPNEAGIEDADTLKRLINDGCEFGQGYHWSPALPTDKFEEFVRARVREVTGLPRRAIFNSASSSSLTS